MLNPSFIVEGLSFYVNPSTKIKSENLFGGIIVRIKAVSTQSNVIKRFLFNLIPFIFTKVLIFWLPYKETIKFDKYGNLGPASRGKYSRKWYFVKKDHFLYSMTEKEFKNFKNYSQKASLKLIQKHIIKVRQKYMKKELDKLIFKQSNYEQN